MMVAPMNISKFEKHVEGAIRIFAPIIGVIQPPATSPIVHLRRRLDTSCLQLAKNEK